MITRVLIGKGDRRIRGREGDKMTQADVSERERDRDRERIEDAELLVLKMEARSSGGLFPLETGKHKEMGSSQAFGKNTAVPTL